MGMDSDHGIALLLGKPTAEEESEKQLSMKSFIRAVHKKDLSAAIDAFETLLEAFDEDPMKADDDMDEESDKDSKDLEF